VVDSEIIAKAPSRLLAAGMGDALATFFEARAVAASNKTAMAGGNTSLTALALAQLCYDTLLENGLKAKLAVDANTTSKAVEAIIEANTYLSGVGFESGGLAAAHAIHNGLTVLEGTHGMYHGEKVAFGTIVQLVLENACDCELEQVIGFCKTLGLPTTLQELGVGEAADEDLMAVAKASCADGETIHNMPFEVTAEAVYSAIVVADKLGRL
jgi:glycerol dehydrogenase